MNEAFFTTMTFNLMCVVFPHNMSVLVETYVDQGYEEFHEYYDEEANTSWVTFIDSDNEKVKVDYMIRDYGEQLRVCTYYEKAATVNKLKKRDPA